MVVKLEFLGSGNAFLPQGRFHSLLLINDSILIDCPPTALASLRRIELSPSKLNSIMFTHWHGDHVFGFPFVILERKWISDRSGVEPLGIHGPKGCKERLSTLCETAYPGSMEDRLKEFEWNEDSEVYRDFQRQQFHENQWNDSFGEITYEGKNWTVSSLTRWQANQYESTVEQIPNLRIDLAPTPLANTKFYNTIAIEFSAFRQKGNLGELLQKSKCLLLRILNPSDLL